jgi:hypothetical protein
MGAMAGDLPGMICNGADHPLSVPADIDPADT